MAFSVLEWAKPATLFSDYENRYLQQKPTFSLQNVLNGTYQRQYENYVNDQFMFRNGWVKIKTFTYTVMQKNEYKNVVKGEHDFLFKKQFSFHHRLESNQDHLSKFLDRHPNSLAFIAMTSYHVHREYLKHPFLWIDQREWMDTFNHERRVDPCKIFDQPKEPLFYKSDHHWNLKGAYGAASIILDQMGIMIKEYDAYPIQSKDGFLGSHYKQMLPLFYPSEPFFYLDREVRMTLYDQTYDHLFNQRALDSANYYDGFLYGNHGFLSIDTMNEGAKILVIKDSYANSVIPFLTDYFQQIDVIDLRYFNDSLQKTIQEGSYDHILFLENFDQFQESRHTFKLFF